MFSLFYVWFRIVCRLELQAKLNGRERFSVDVRISFRREGEEWV